MLELQIKKITLFLKLLCLMEPKYSSSYNRWSNRAYAKYISNQKGCA